MKLIISFVCLLAFACPFVSHGQTGPGFWRPPVHQFDLVDQGFQPIAYTISQGTDGRIFAGGSEGIIEFDGSSWRKLPMSVPARSTVHSLQASADGTVYFGGQGEFGYIGEDESGTSIPVPLNGVLKETIPFTTTFWDISEKAEGVYFLADSMLVRVQGEQSAIWHARVPFSRMYAPDSDVFIIDINGIVHRLVDDQLVPVLDFEGVIEDFITFILPAPGSALWMGTYGGKIFRWQPGTPPERFELEGASYFAEHLLEGADSFPDGSFFLRSWRKGGRWYDATGRLMGTFDDDRFPIDLEQINEAFEDADGNTWYATSRGLMIMDRSSPMHEYASVLPSDAEATAVIMHKGVPTFGIGEDIWSVSENRDGDPDLRHLIHMDGRVQDLSSFGDLLFAKTNNEWMSLDTGHPEPIGFEGGQLRSARINGDSWLIAGGASGISIYSASDQGSPIALQRTVSPDYSVEDFAIDSRGVLWGLISPAGIVRADLSTHDDVVLTWFEGVDYSESLTGVATFEERVVLSSSSGIVMPRLADGVLSLEEWTAPLPEPFGMPIWVNTLSDSTLIVGVEGGAAVLDQQGFSATLIPGSKGLQTVVSDRTNGTSSGWGIRDGIPVRLDLMNRLSGPLPRRPRFRRVVANGSLQSVHGDSVHVSLSRAVNTLRFDFASATFSAEPEMRYSTRVDPLDDSWSEWSMEPRLDLVRLAPGDYEVAIRARSATAAVSLPLKATFTVRGPWYQTLGTWILWVGLMIGGGIIGATKIQRRRIQQFRERTEELTSEVAFRTQEISAQKTQLESQAVHLRELDQAKSRFFTNLSHEFRTPLTLMAGPISEALEGRYGSLTAEGKTAFERAETNADRLNRLINQLLDLSRLESGTIQLNCADHNLSDFARKITGLFTSLAGESGVALRIQTEEEDKWANYDQDHMEKILVNLLSNAIKFTPEAGSIDVAVSASEEWALLSVRDSGIGIPEPLRQRVFERFFQVDDSSTREQEGMGIGLAMSREYARAMGGDIILDSAEGGGSLFTVRIPLASAGWKGPGVGEILSQALPDPSTGVQDSALRDRSSRSAEDAPTILVVEDNADLADYLVELLDGSYDVHVAHDGVDGFDRAMELIPDIVISDVMMPKRDGFELCRMLKADVRSSHIPVMLLTAKAQVDDRIEGFATGADAYLEKPFNARELDARIAAILDQRERLRKLFSGPLQSRSWSTESGSALSPRDREFIEQLEAIAESHFCLMDFGVDQLAHLMHLSRRQLLRKISSLTGSSPAEMILAYRLGRAAELLVSTPDSISVIAERVGFRSRSHFSKQFAASHGMPPAEYASRKQGE